MFVVKSNEEIGSYLESLIYKNYPSVRQFCINYLEIDPRADSEDPQEIRNMTNRFSQIIHGNKSIQTYDLPYLSHLLDVSCEELLSCGEVKVPLNSRMTNYNVAFSHDKKVWEEYIAREDCIASYSDEFGKTVVDYAIDFKNYKFLKFLMDNGYITLVREDARYQYDWNFGAQTSLTTRPYEQKTLGNELSYNKLLRTHILALALENNDIKTLEALKGREVPPQHDIHLMSRDLKLNEYYDETYIKAIALASSKIIDFFLEEYNLPANNNQYEITWIYPFVGELAKECIKLGNKDKANKILDAIIKHNQKVYDELHKKVLKSAKLVKDDLSFTYQDAVHYIARDYNVAESKDFVTFLPYRVRDIEPSWFNIINISCKSKDIEIQNKIDSINNLHEKILNIPNSLIKND